MSFPIRDKEGKSLTWQEGTGKIGKRIESYLLDFCLMLLNLATYIPLHSVRNWIWRLSGIKIGCCSTPHRY
jgi:hypothetical protein